MDPLHPVPPQPAYFDSAKNQWVLSRYADVLAAFRDPRLWPVGTRSRNRSEIGDEAAANKLRGDLQTALAADRLAAWDNQFTALAHRMIDALPRARSVDLVGELARPWALQVAISVTGADAACATQLAELARTVSDASAEPYDDTLQAAKAVANPQLEAHFTASTMPMAAAAFVGLSNTLPSLIGNMWAALLRHPGEMARLRDDIDLLPRALEELLRYSGLTRMLFRQAMADADIGSVQIREGGAAKLLVASANRDPEQFPEPNRLDLTRRATGQLTLGAAAHVCAGGSLTRMASSVAVRVLVERFTAAALREPVEWRGGSGFQTPATLWVDAVQV